MLRGVVALAMLGIATAAQADYKDRLMGNWLVTAEADRFGDGGIFIAKTGAGGYALVVRCLQKELSIAVMILSPDPKPVKEGDLFLFKFKVDLQPVVETGGEAIHNRTIQLDTEKSLVKAIQYGRETAMRMENRQGVSTTIVFKTAGASIAFTDLAKECPLD